MKKIVLLLLLGVNFVQAQITPTPDTLWGQLFKDVQQTKALGDNKTFVDLVPKFSPAIILTKYQQYKTRDSIHLHDFVMENFFLPQNPKVTVTQNLPLKEHLEQLWTALTREKDSVRKNSSLLPLPGSYVVPGGRFREIYYWDSY
jgi:alpha,alpha-trehalase